jgi:mannose-6-phosphate isomerase-like protein (cupin superfamily)
MEYRSQKEHRHMHAEQGNQARETKFRRVVTGHTDDGQAVIVSDILLDKQVWSRGVEVHKLWGADVTPTYPDDGSLTVETDFSWFPPLDGFRFVHFQFPPNDTLTADEMDQDNSGMHASNTVDLLYVMAGRCILKMGDGSKVELAAGDVLIQNGTLHTWFNPFSEPCRIIGVLIGAYRE